MWSHFPHKSWIGSTQISLCGRSAIFLPHVLLPHILQRQLKQTCQKSTQELIFSMNKVNTHCFEFNLLCLSLSQGKLSQCIIDLMISVSRSAMCQYVFFINFMVYSYSCCTSCNDTRL